MQSIPRPQDCDSKANISMLAGRTAEAAGEVVTWSAAAVSITARDVSAGATVATCTPLESL
jgi:hypothetical protein